MRFHGLLICSLLLSTAAGHALPVRSHRPPSPDATLDSELPMPGSPLPTKADKNPLYYSLGSDPVPARAKELEFRIEVDGRPYLEEKIPLSPNAAGATFEILAGDTSRRERLLSLSKSRHKVQVTVLIDGRTVRTVPLREIAAASRQLPLPPAAIQSSVGAVRTFAPDPAEETSARPVDPALLKGYFDQTCVNGCDAQRTDCVASECPMQFFCEVCDNQHASCVNSCWVCTDPKSVTNTSYSQLISATFVGSQCFHPSSAPYQTNYYYDRLLLTVRTYYVQRTEYCNGSTSETVLSYSDSYGYCNHPTPYSCSSPSGNAYDVCY